MIDATRSRNAHRVCFRRGFPRIEPAQEESPQKPAQATSYLRNRFRKNPAVPSETELSDVASVGDQALARGAKGVPSESTEVHYCRLRV